jgi:hypothetical protein
MTKLYRHLAELGYIKRDKRTAKKRILVLGGEQ